MDDNEVIDLTQIPSYSRTPIPLNNLNCAVIDLDDSIYASPRPAFPEEPIVIECETEALPAINVTKVCQNKKCKKITKKKTLNIQKVVPAPSPERPGLPYYGICPICREPLGTQPLASTKCGHVYCISCLTQALNMEKKCPTCRKPLKGATAYHPLFLS